LGYVDRTAAALPDEPEAVSAAEQGRQTTMAHRRAELMRLEAFAAMSQTVNGAVDQFAQAVKDQRLASPLRQVKRSVAAVGRRLGQ
jgi:hypothetical protein